MANKIVRDELKQRGVSLGAGARTRHIGADSCPLVKV